MSFILLGILNSQVEAAGGGSYELIATANGTGSSGTITFSDIPQTYKHLQIRAVVRSTETGNNGALVMRLNSDSGSNYARHNLIGNGSSVTSSASTSTTAIASVAIASNQMTTGIHTPFVIDILDYASTSKNTTYRALHQRNATASAEIWLSSGLWINTAAVTTITITDVANWTTSTRFSLYGIKG